MIGAACQTQKVQTGSPLLSARQSGVPYHAAREALFDRLHDAGPCQCAAHHHCLG